MAQIVRVGDVNNAGGRVLEGSPTVLVNGIAVAINNSPVECHNNFKGEHTHAHCVASQSTVLAAGVPVIFVNDSDSCGHTRIAGSPDTAGP